MAHAEVWLFALFVALYLFDSALLLHSNEALLLQGRGSRWLVGFGSSKILLRGLELYIPNPLLPTRPGYRLGWQQDATVARKPTSKVVRQVQPLALVVLIWNHFWLSFVVLPFALFAQWGDAVVLLAFALIYANVVLLSLALWWHRRVLGLAGKELASTVVEIAICPPFALNLIRRLSLRRRIDEDLVVAAKRLQRPVDWELTKIELRSRLSHELEGEEPDAPRAKALRAQYDQLS